MRVARSHVQFLRQQYNEESARMSKTSIPREECLFRIARYQHEIEAWRRANVPLAALLSCAYCMS